MYKEIETQVREITRPESQIAQLGPKLSKSGAEFILVIIILQSLLKHKVPNTGALLIAQQWLVPPKRVLSS